ncbi:IPTL-CTERM sorting domain-containing protein, partial [Comamonas piscis]
LTNAGTVTMLSGGTSNVLTVAGNYVGNGGVISMNTAVGAADSATEKLVVNGDSSGTTTLNITNVGGAGAPTIGNGILVVQVDGASNGTFSLPAPGYLEVGGFRYLLVKIGNNWYLSNSERTEASSIEASVACTPSQLGGSAGLVATCTVSLNAAPLADFPVNLTLPATNPRYTTTCGSPIVVAANASEASCTITAVASNDPNEGDMTAELSIAPPTVPDAYVAVGTPAQVQILGNGRPGAGAHAVPTLGTVGLVAMASLMGLMGLRRSRKHNGRQG